MLLLGLIQFNTIFWLFGSGLLFWVTLKNMILQLKVAKYDVHGRVGLEVLNTKCLTYK